MQGLECLLTFLACLVGCLGLKETYFTKYEHGFKVSIFPSVCNLTICTTGITCRKCVKNDNKMSGEKLTKYTFTLFKMCVSNFTKASSQMEIFIDIYI